MRADIHTGDRGHAVIRRKVFHGSARRIIALSRNRDNFSWPHKAQPFVKCSKCGRLKISLGTPMVALFSSRRHPGTATGRPGTEASGRGTTDPPVAISRGLRDFTNHPRPPGRLATCHLGHLTQNVQGRGPPCHTEPPKDPQWHYCETSP